MKSILSFILSLSSFCLLAQDCSELFFSEYVEGSSNNKAVEIYNPTDVPIDLSSYSIERYSNGNGLDFDDDNNEIYESSDAMNLSGIINPGDTWVVTLTQILQMSLVILWLNYITWPINGHLFTHLHCI